MFGKPIESHLTMDDLQAISAKCPTLIAPAPIVHAGQTVLVYGSKHWVPQMLLGTSPAWFKLNERLDFEEGSAFTDMEVQNNGEFCVIGKTVERKLFGNTPALGQEISLQALNYKVIGVLSPKGVNVNGQDRDDVVLLPWTTAKIYLNNPTASSAISPNKSIDQILLAAGSSNQIQDAIKQITAVLREHHHLASGQPDDFTLRVWIRKNGDLGDPLEIPATH